MNDYLVVNDALSSLHRESRNLPPEVEYALARLLDQLAEMVGRTAPQDMQLLRERLSEISVYTLRKQKEAEVESHYYDSMALKDIRNLFAHGMGRTDRDRMAHYEEAIWRILTRSAHSWEPLELDNFLAYCIGQHLETRVDYDSPEKIIRSYRRMFKSLDTFARQKSLEEMVMRITSDPRLRKIVGE